MSNLLSTLRQCAENISPGGAWNNGGDAGLWYLSLDNDRSDFGPTLGFRPEELLELVRDAEEAPRLREEIERLTARVAELEAAGLMKGDG